MMHGMCIRCGAEVSEPDQPGIPLRCASVLRVMSCVSNMNAQNDVQLLGVRYLHLGLQVSSQEAERIR